MLLVHIVFENIAIIILILQYCQYVSGLWQKDFPYENMGLVAKKRIYDYCKTTVSKL